MPTPGRFEGQHFETVYPNKWQHIIWEIPDLYRDCVTGFSVNIMLAGAPAGASEHMSLYIDDMRIEKVEAENSRGFDLRKDAMAYCHSGYKPGARKQLWCSTCRKGLSACTMPPRDKPFIKVRPVL